MSEKKTAVAAPAPDPNENPGSTGASLAGPSTPNVSSSGVSSNPFANIERWRLNQNFSAEGAVERITSEVSVGRPDDQQFVRIHPAETHRLTTLVIKLKKGGETFLVDPRLQGDATVAKEAKPKILFFGTDRYSSLFIWPINLETTDGWIDSYSQSARVAAEKAMKSWVRVRTNRARGEYIVETPVNPPPEPVWPTEGFAELLAIAFRGKIIDSLDHPVLRRLRGES